MAKGFFFLAAVLAALTITASFSFVNYFSVSSPEIDRAVSQLRLPSDAAYELSRFEDPQRLLTSFLKAAWENAAEAQRLSKELYKVEISFSLEGLVDAVKAVFGVKVQEKKAELFVRLDAAHRAAWDSLSGVLHLAEGALAELGEWGADNENYSGIAHENYEKDEAVFRELGVLFEAASLANGSLKRPASCAGVVNRTACLIASADESLSLDEKVGVFNELVGRPGSALVDDYYSVYGLLISAKKAMLAEVEGLSRAYAERAEQLAGKIRDLEAEDPGLVNSRVVEALSQDKRLVLKAGSSGDFAQLFRKLRANADAADVVFKHAEWLYSGRTEDRVFHALEEKAEAVRMVEDLLSQAAGLEEELAGLKQQADALFSRLSDSPAVLELVGEAASEKSAGKALAKYAKAAELAQANESMLEYLDRAVRSIERYADVSEEKSILSRLAQLPLSEEVAASAWALEQKLRLKAASLLAQVDELRSRAEDFFQASTQLAAVFPKEFESADLAEVGRRLERFALLDTLSNAGLLYEEYSAIIETLSGKVYQSSADYLKKSAASAVSSPQPIVCGMRTQTMLSVNVCNSLPVGLPKAGFYVDYGPDAAYVSVPPLAPGAQNTAAFNVSLVPVVCTVKEEVLYADEYETRVVVSVKASASFDAQVSPPVLVVPLENRMIELPWRGGSFSENLVETTGPVIVVDRQKQEFNDTRGFRIVKTLTVRSNASAKNLVVREAAPLDASDISASISFKRAGPFLLFSIPSLQAFEEKQIILSYLTTPASLEVNITQLQPPELSTLTQPAAEDEQQKPAAHVTQTQAKFDAVRAYKKAELMKQLLADFKKAISTDESLPTDGLVFSQKDYDEAKAWLKRLEKAENDSFFQEAASLEDFLNNSLSSLKTLARNAVQRAVSDAEADGDKKSLQFAAAAKNAFMQDEYSKALQYAAQVPPRREQQTSPPLLYLAAAVPLLAFAFFMLRKPKQPPKPRPVKTSPGGDFDD